MYLIPKNIKVKREIFKGYGVKEIILLGISVLIGFTLSTLSLRFVRKIWEKVIAKKQENKN